MPKVEGNKIIFAKHVVICSPDVADAEYLAIMADSLSPDGSAKQHVRELDRMNNDGSWTVEPK